jgi:methyl-accepting chemotaxis protein
MHDPSSHQRPALQWRSLGSWIAPSMREGSLALLRPLRFVRPALRFRAKVMLGFVAVLAISAICLGVAYLGFERVSGAVASYRDSVSEADLARNIDGALTVYRAAARYYIVTGKEDDAKAALAAERHLKESIETSLRDTNDVARNQRIRSLASESNNLTITFSEIIKTKRESALLVQNQLERLATSFLGKLDEIANIASDAEAQAIESGTKQVTAQFVAAKGDAGIFAIMPDQPLANRAVAQLKLVESSLGRVYSMDDKVVAALKEAAGLLRVYREAFAKLIEQAGLIDDLVARMNGSAASITQGASAMKQELLSDQRRLEIASNEMIGKIEQLIVLLAVGAIVVGGVLALLLGRSISQPMIAMCRAMRDLAGGNFDVVLPGLGRKDELGEMAAAVEEFKRQAIAKAERDAAIQDKQNQETAAARRAELIRFADEFENAVGSIVSNVFASAAHLEEAAGKLTQTAETTQCLSSEVTSRSDEASKNIRFVASSTEQLSSSINDIGRRVQESSRIAEAAVAQALDTDARIAKLSRAAQEIGDVITLITTIAGQTNLLALNASIEAARAGDAGKGFAVVAAEVKSLADQTAKATQEISSHISGMQAATQESVAAIKQIGATIGKISTISSSIADAVEEQVSSMHTMASNVQNVADGTGRVAANIVEVNRGATETGAASEDVLTSAKTLSNESIRLREELARFMANVRAA